MPGQIGLEETPEKYVAKMVEIFREVRRILRNDGTLWLNLGDSHAGSWGNYHPNSPPGKHGQRLKETQRWNRPAYDDQARLPPTANCPGLKPKDLCGVPWRVAFALQADGWWLRSDIIWEKPNPMPESVTDRPTRAHEYLFLLAKSSRYFYDAEAIREPVTLSSIKRYELAEGRSENPPAYGDYKAGSGRGQSRGQHADHLVLGGKRDKQRGHSRRHDGFNDRWDLMTMEEQCALMRNKRSVWEIATEPFLEAHFATFPQKLVEPCILAGTSEKGACGKCGAPQERMVERTVLPPPDRQNNNRFKHDSMTTHGEGEATLRNVVRKETYGWRPACPCNAGTMPCIVLDPFMGSGTSALVALRLNRNFLGIELNPDYVKMAESRISQELAQGKLNL